MKKLFIQFLILMVMLIPTIAFADDAPEFTKRDVYLFYQVPDQILMCQNKKEDMVEGAKEFEEVLLDHFDNRFNVVATERVQMKFLDNGKFDDLQKKEMFSKAGNVMPIIVELKLMGNGTATDTYQNIFGAKKSITVPTTKIDYTEYFGVKNDNTFYQIHYGTFDYHANTFAMGGQLWSKKMDARVLTKNCVKWIVRDMNKFNAPNKYTNPTAYNRYLAIYTGNIEKLLSMNE